MLLLKSCDFVEMNQDESYEDISITPGLRFDELHPAVTLDSDHEVNIVWSSVAAKRNERSKPKLQNIRRHFEPKGKS